MAELHAAIDRLNPEVPATAREDTLKKDGETRGDFVRLIDCASPNVSA